MAIALHFGPQQRVRVRAPIACIAHQQIKRDARKAAREGLEPAIPIKIEDSRACNTYGIRRTIQPSPCHRSLQFRVRDALRRIAVRTLHVHHMCFGTARSALHVSITVICASGPHDTCDRRRSARRTCVARANVGHVARIDGAAHIGPHALQRGHHKRRCRLLYSCARPLPLCHDAASFFGRESGGRG
jgi:hypothetical protein